MRIQNTQKVAKIFLSQVKSEKLVDMSSRFLSLEVFIYELSIAELLSAFIFYERFKRKFNVLFPKKFAVFLERVAGSHIFWGAQDYIFLHIL